jgi:hypothetical protein
MLNPLHSVVTLSEYVAADGETHMSKPLQKKVPRSETVRLRVRPDLKERLREHADRDQRTVSSFVELALMSALNAKTSKGKWSR